ncbi:hypothetical protein [Arthrobacter sp. CG_A4]|uniref:hypothetical protein n=1 Tax=Arthrobacter sp. CG_A4 TaxID=3071706 RepID=UPI002E034FCF|nr:hypothetical protein [Arthrobacter sp. CG_A4]
MTQCWGTPNASYENVRAITDAGVRIHHGVAVNDPALTKKDGADPRRGGWSARPE